MQHSTPTTTEQALAEAKQAHEAAERLGDLSAQRHLKTLIAQLVLGATFAWEGSTLVVNSTSGNSYQVSRACCTCPNGQKGKYDCWHWLLRGLIENMDPEPTQAAPVALGDRLSRARQHLGLVGV